MTLEEAEAYKASRSTGNESGDTVPVNAHAFEDLTDFEVSGFLSNTSYWLNFILDFVEYGFHICPLRLYFARGSFISRRF